MALVECEHPSGGNRRFKGNGLLSFLIFEPARAFGDLKTAHAQITVWLRLGKALGPGPKRRNRRCSAGDAMTPPQRAPSLPKPEDWTLEFPSESSTEKPPAPKRLLDIRPALPGAASIPSRSRANPSFARDTKLAAASCAFGVLLGGLSTWTVIGPVSNTPTVAPSALIPTASPSPPEPLLASRAEQIPLGTAGTVTPPPTETIVARPQSTVPTRRSTVPAPLTATPPNRAASSFAGTLAVNSEPQGARVSIDGESAGVTPLVVTGVKAGSRVVRVTANGYQPWSSAVRVVANQRNVATARLLSISGPGSP